MKIKLNTNLLVNIIIIGFGVVVVFIWGTSLYFTTGTLNFNQKTTKTDSYYWSDNNLKPIDTAIDPLLSYVEYVKLNDSIKTLRSLKNGDFPIGDGSEFSNVLGTSATINCDTCNLKMIFNKASRNASNISYYIKLSGWKIKEAELVYSNDPDSVHYYVRQNKPYIRKVIDVVNKKRGVNIHTMNMVDIPVKFRYSQRDKCLMIPVDKTLKQVLTVVLVIIDIALGLYILYLFSCFLKFMLDISKGIAFTGKNIQRLKLIAASLLAYPILIFLFNFLLRLIFHRYFTEDVVMNSDVWKDSWKIMALGVIFLMLFKAFRQGWLLKEEQELTV